MEINFNLLESKEVIISQVKKEKKRPGDDYDYNDPMFEECPEENILVRLEPVLKDFKIVDDFKESKKVTSSIDIIYAMQNALFHKIKNENYSLEELFTFLLYDLMINHDLSFVKVKEKFNANEAIIVHANKEFLLSFEEIIKNKEKILKEDLIQMGKNEGNYKDNLIVFSDELCLKVFNYCDITAQMRCFDMEVIKKKQFKYNAFKKGFYPEVALFFRNNVTNSKSIGSNVLRVIKNNKIGKYNGYSISYLEC